MPACCMLLLPARMIAPVQPCTGLARPTSELPSGSGVGEFEDTLDGRVALATFDAIVASGVLKGLQETLNPF